MLIQTSILASLSDATDAKFSLSPGPVLRLPALAPLWAGNPRVCCMLLGQAALEGAVCTYLSNTDCITLPDMHKRLEDQK